MPNEPKGIAPVLILGFVAALAIVLGIVFFSHHHLMAGLLIGFAVGIIGTHVFYRVLDWLGAHRISESPPPKQ
jgi:predicted PurR-regulated permease PerM